MSVSVGSQVFAALTVGLLVAFALQLLLTTLGVVVGVSLLSFRSNNASSELDSSNHDSSDGTTRSAAGNTIAKIGFTAGLGLLLTINTVLFTAAFLAVRFSLVTDPISGAILGVVIWSAYFLILTWVSSSTAGSVISFILGSAATGLKQILSIIGDRLSGINQTNTPLTEDVASAMIQREVQTALNGINLPVMIERYLQTVPQSPQNTEWDGEAIRQELTTVLNELDIESLAEAGLLQQVDRRTFADLVHAHTTLSESETEAVVQQLEQTWQSILDRHPSKNLNRAIVTLIESASVDELTIDHLLARLEQLAGAPSPAGLQGTIKEWIAQQPIDFKTIKHTLLQRLDLSELDVSKIWQQLQSLRSGGGDPTGTKQDVVNTIRLDVEDYLLHAYPWELEQTVSQTEFRDVLYDADASPEHVRSQLETVELKDFKDILHQRDDLTSTQVESITQWLETTRLDVLATVRSAEQQQQAQELLQQVEHELQTMDKARLKSTHLLTELIAKLQSLEADPTVLEQVSQHWQELNFKTILQERKDLKTDEVKRVSKQLKKLGERLTIPIDQPQKETQSNDFKQKLESYLRYTNPQQLTAEHIDRKLKTLVQDVAHLVPSMLPSLELDALREILERRQAISAEQIEQILTQIEQLWQQLLEQSRSLAEYAQTQTRQWMTLLVHYLKQTANADLTQAEFKQGLVELLTASTAGWAARKQLMELDWQELKHQLQINGMSEEQISRSLSWMQDAIYSVLKAPRRWATRTQHVSKDLLTHLEHYLRYNATASFKPETIAHHLQLLMKNSYRELGQGAKSSSVDWVASIDRATIGAWLAERMDLQTEEIESISTTIESTIKQIIGQLAETRSQAQSTSEFLTAKLSDYFNSFNLMNLDYDQIKVELQKFFKNPELPFNTVNQSVRSLLDAVPLDNLGEYLGQISYDALITSLKSLNPLPAASDQFIRQVEGVKQYVLTQVETVKQTALLQVESLKQTVLNQAEEARKAVVVAAWWLFSIAVSSAIASAVAGSLAVFSMR